LTTRIFRHHGLRKKGGERLAPADATGPPGRPRICYKASQVLNGGGGQRFKGRLRFSPITFWFFALEKRGRFLKRKSPRGGGGVRGKAWGKKWGGGWPGFGRKFLFDHRFPAEMVFCGTWLGARCQGGGGRGPQGGGGGEGTGPPWGGGGTPQGAPFFGPVFAPPPRGASSSGDLFCGSVVV